MADRHEADAVSELGEPEPVPARAGFDVDPDERRVLPWVLGAALDA